MIIQHVTDQHLFASITWIALPNRLLNWFAGGLNFQIEHHLFPHISHTHYPDISGIVRLTAKEFGLPYNCYETYFSSINGHYRVLRELGKEPQGSEASQTVR
jgi:linoleoyl-CoA desaturase